eukprot:TRINITY_DN10315_c0_g1_i2.p1 TRINITY_DN10315_c0_g1~~TRINITY_DN10315_c0_g1_i2.p1  ORF type:complete len:347 (-),score=51.11 TRINITY_DN10315_c0_g1_i2:42-1082(-)
MAGFHQDTSSSVFKDFCFGDRIVLDVESLASFGTQLSTDIDGTDLSCNGIPCGSNNIMYEFSILFGWMKVHHLHAETVLKALETLSFESVPISFLVELTRLVTKFRERHREFHRRIVNGSLPFSTKKKYSDILVFLNQLLELEDIHQRVEVMEIGATLPETKSQINTLLLKIDFILDVLINHNRNFIKFLGVAKGVLNAVSGNNRPVSLLELHFHLTRDPSDWFYLHTLISPSGKYPEAGEWINDFWLFQAQLLRHQLDLSQAQKTLDSYLLTFNPTNRYLSYISIPWWWWCFVLVLLVVFLLLWCWFWKCWFFFLSWWWSCWWVCWFWVWLWWWWWWWWGGGWWG